MEIWKVLAFDLILVLLLGWRILTLCGMKIKVQELK